MTTAQDGGKVVSLTRRLFYPQEMLLVLISSVLNTVGNCNTEVSVAMYCIVILWDHRHICGPSLAETSLCGS